MAAMVEQDTAADQDFASIQAVSAAFREFLHHYSDPITISRSSNRGSVNSSFDSAHANGSESNRLLKPRYVREAQNMARTQTLTLYINYHHLDPEDDLDDDSDDDDDDIVDSKRRGKNRDDSSDLLQNSSNRSSHHHSTKRQRSRRFLSPEQLAWMTQVYYTVEPHLVLVLREFLAEVVPLYVPRDDTRQFSISIFNYRSQLTVRTLQPEYIGRLVSIRAMATKSTKVSPEVSVGSFRCRDCHNVTHGVRQEFKITLPSHCINADCTNKRLFDLLPEDSTFTDWQQLTVQESTESLPAGSVPRTIKVILRGEMVEVAKPGDQCVITGVLLSVPDVSQLYSRTEVRTSEARDTENAHIRGLKELGVREMSYRTVLLASNITRLSGTGATPYPDSLVAKLDGIDNYQAGLHSFGENDITSINQLKSKPNLPQILVNSIAPNVYGHDLVKKGILFMILGGVHKTTKDRTSVRGDINVLLIGDPSTAKSQFLKFVSDFLPRVVYTSGKSSTAAGLTASVARDSDTGEFVIEAGALMLADNGVCCIDEFDKMDQKDQSAIHEAMEQQTISIAKAGIQATLNARTSILAAANPIAGRYDTTRTLKQNVNITPPIMSRFDLYFILVDQPNPANDRSIAKHMIASHVSKLIQARRTLYGGDTMVDTSLNNAKLDNYFATVPSKQSTHELLPASTLRSFIRYARQLDPQLTDESRELIIKTYADLRQRDLLGNSLSSYKVTVRQLESLIRLSQACARMYLSTEVTEDHVREAAELLNRSIVSVKQSSALIDLGQYHGGDDDDDDNNSDDDGFDGGVGGGGSGPGGKKRRDDSDDDDHDDEKKGEDKKGAFGPAGAMKRRRGQKYKMGDDDEDNVEAEPIALQEAAAAPAPEEEVGSSQQITTEEYNQVCFTVVKHLEDLRDEKLGLALQAFADENNIDLDELSSEQIEDVLSEKPFIISAGDLLNWLLPQQNLFNLHLKAKFGSKLAAAADKDRTEGVDTNTAAVEAKVVKHKKKVIKLVLRRMMLEDNSIINREGSIEVHPDYTSARILHTAPDDRVNEVARKERGRSRDDLAEYSLGDIMGTFAPVSASKSAHTTATTSTQQQSTQDNDDDDGNEAEVEEEKEDDLVDAMTSAPIVDTDSADEDGTPLRRPNTRAASLRSPQSSQASQMMGDDDEEEDISRSKPKKTGRKATKASQKASQMSEIDDDGEEEELSQPTRTTPRRSGRK